MRSADRSITREIALWLLAYEGAEGGTPVPSTQAAYRVCDKLRRPLTTLAGAAGFRSLLARALTLAKQESPALAGWEVKSDGSLEVLNDEPAQFGAVLIAQLIGLLVTFIGESLTLRLLHDVWVHLPHSEMKLERIKSK